MSLFKFELDGKSIHLAVQESCGGSTIGLQMARQSIENGGRVLWAAPELPDGVRFSQIFDGIDPVSSSKFHAMNLVGNFDQALQALVSAAEMLPNVDLVVLDDYCPKSGKIPNDIIKGVNKLIEVSNWTTLLISKGGVSMDEAPLNARGSNEINASTVWLLTRQQTDNRRMLHMDDNKIELVLTEDGYKL